MLVSCRINHKSNVKSYKFVFSWLQSLSTSYLKSRTTSCGEDTTLAPNLAGEEMKRRKKEEI